MLNPGNITGDAIAFADHGSGRWVRDEAYHGGKLMLALWVSTGFVRKLNRDSALLWDLSEYQFPSRPGPAVQVFQPRR